VVKKTKPKLQHLLFKIIQHQAMITQVRQTHARLRVMWISIFMSQF